MGLDQQAIEDASIYISVNEPNSWWLISNNVDG